MFRPVSIILRSDRNMPICGNWSRAFYTYATDDEALEAFQVLSKLEGIIPALESAHAVAEAIKRAPTMPRESVILVNLSGRGDKDLDTVIGILGE